MSQSTPLRERLLQQAEWIGELYETRLLLREAAAALSARQEEGAVAAPDAAWQQASSEVFSTPLSQVREKYGTGDLYKAIASRADELRATATPPAASGEAGAVFRAAAPDAAAPSVPSPTVRLTVPAAPASGDAKDALDVLAGLRRFITHAHCQIDAPRETIARYDAAVATLARLAAVAPAGMVLVPIVPTKEMLESDCGRIPTRADVWRGMIAAAPTSATKGEKE